MGTSHEHESNLRLLEREKCSARRASSLEEYRRLLSTDVSGVVVGRTWWATLPESEHSSFVTHLFNYSSCIWLKVNVCGCASIDFQDVCKKARFRNAHINEVAISQTTNIEERELKYLQNAAQLVYNPKNIRLCPADIEPNRALILIAGITNHVQSRHPLSAVNLEEIGTTVIRGGQSQSLIVRAQPNDEGLPLVAKLGTIDALRDEMSRFQRFILPWDDVGPPQLHFHDDQAAIVFGLIASPEAPKEPAPTLEDSLLRAQYLGKGTHGGDSQPEKDYFDLIRRTTRKLSSLNARRCSDTFVTSKAWMDTSNLDELLANVVWEFPRLPGGSCPLSLRQTAVGIVKGSLCNAATVHGDIHLTMR